jgi:hypothetical protein
MIVSLIVHKLEGSSSQTQMHACMFEMLADRAIMLSDLGLERSFSEARFLTTVCMCGAQKREVLRMQAV